MEDVVEGSVDAAVAAEFPGLAVLSTIVDPAGSNTPAGLVAELDAAANRIRGATAVRASTGSVAAAYRAFMRQLGMDPGRVPGTVEDITMRRLVEGGFRPSGLLHDAVSLAVLETEVPLMVLDAKGLPQPVSIEVAGSGGSFHARGDVVLTCGSTPVARLFDLPFPDFRVGRRTRPAIVVAVVVDGVDTGVAGAALQRATDLASTR